MEVGGTRAFLRALMVFPSDCWLSLEMAFEVLRHSLHNRSTRVILRVTTKL
jgi:hypothetical protein